MHLPCVCTTRALACTAVICIGNGSSLALTTGLAGPATAGPNPGYAVTLLTGGGRIWEGETASRPTADITFAGHIEKIGPGNQSADHLCRWTVRFQNVQGTECDNAVFTARECAQATVWAAGDEPDAGLRVVLRGDLNVISGYTLVILAVDMTEPGAQDQVRMRLFSGGFIPGEPDPPDPRYDTNWEFSIYPGTSARTYLDSGNLQSKVETTTP